MDNSIPGTPGGGNGPAHILKNLTLDALDRGALAEAIKFLALAVEDLARPRRLAIVDGQERERITLAADGPEPSIVVADTEGRRRLALVLAEDGSPAVRLYDAVCKPLATLAAGPGQAFREDAASPGSYGASLRLEAGGGAEVDIMALSQWGAEVTCKTEDGKNGNEVGADILAHPAGRTYPARAEVGAWAMGGNRFIMRAQGDEEPVEIVGRTR